MNVAQHSCIMGIRRNFYSFSISCQACLPAVREEGKQHLAGPSLCPTLKGVGRLCKIGMKPSSKQAQCDPHQCQWNAAIWLAQGTVQALSPLGVLSGKSAWRRLLKIAENCSEFLKILPWIDRWRVFFFPTNNGNLEEQIIQVWIGFFWGFFCTCSLMKYIWP